MSNEDNALGLGDRAASYFTGNNSFAATGWCSDKNSFNAGCDLSFNLVNDFYLIIEQVHLKIPVAALKRPR